MAIFHLRWRHARRDTHDAIVNGWLCMDLGELNVDNSSQVAVLRIGLSYGIHFYMPPFRPG